jgi:pimeloyl-ACP methyl ester carboxylesterase|tara:strand:- start:5647 stop:6483 length:837 start_codon:yes stop_codon:yes gene_type:complete
MITKFKGHDDLVLAGDLYGSELDPLVLLLHGGGQTRHAWGGTAKKFVREGFQVLSLDLRGHGDSEWHPKGDYSISSHKQDVVSILEFLDKPAFLVGASLGGMISLSLAGDEEKSDFCKALVMVDIGLYPDPKGADKVVGFMQSGKKGFASIDDAANAVSSYLPHRKRPRDTKGLSKNLRLKEDGRYYWHWDPLFINRRSSSYDDFQEEQLNAASRVISPTLLVRGALSDVLTEVDVEKFLSIIEHSEFIEIRDAAHMIAGDRNDIFAESALSFLKKHS